MKLVDKDAVVAEIKRAYNQEAQWMEKQGYTDYHQGLRDGYTNSLSFLDTLEVEEIDLEDSIKETLAQKYIDYTFKRYNIDQESKEGQLIYYAYMHGMNQCLNQLKSQKGE